MALVSGRLRRSAPFGFTVIELLFVVIIVAVLIAILIPALSRAREQGRRVKCMSNQRTLAQGVQAYAVEHRGYGQLLARRLGYQLGRLFPDRYVYERWSRNLVGLGTPQAGQLAVSPWPVAYGPYIGAPGLRSDAYFVTDAALFANRESALSKTYVGVLRCPSDRSLIGGVKYPGPLFGAMSYSISNDLFDIYRGWPQVWRDGGQHGRTLAGRLDGVVRPSEVLMFVDGGNDFSADLGALRDRFFFSGSFGPTLSAFNRGYPGTLPSHRHSKDGLLIGAYVDGHAGLIRPVRWDTVDLSYHTVAGAHVSVSPRAPVLYSPDPRITPYDPGNYSPGNDYPEGAPRAR